MLMLYFGELGRINTLDFFVGFAVVCVVIKVNANRLVNHIREESGKVCIFLVLRQFCRLRNSHKLREVVPAYRLIVGSKLFGSLCPYIMEYVAVLVALLNIIADDEPE